MHMFTLNVITSGRQTITVRSVERGPLSSKDAGTNRVIVKGIDPETSYGQEDLADLARVFAGAGVRWRGCSLARQSSPGRLQRVWRSCWPSRGVHNSATLKGERVWLAYSCGAVINRLLESR